MPSTFPASAGGNAFQSIISAAGGGGGWGISAPPSISSGISQFIGASVPRTAGVARGTIDEFIGSAVPRTAGRVGGFFSNIGRSIGAAAPFLGLSLGSSLGGQSVAGQVAGAAGGFLTGGLLAAKLTTGIFSKAATAFFNNPITAIAGVGLLVGSVLLGRAAQRRKDEEASGQFLTQALQGIEELAAGVASGQIPGSQARQIFENQILGTFRQQIGGLKTKSVVESRLTNQVADLRRVFEARIPPLIAEQERKAADAARFAAIDSRLVPQFAGGGTVPGIDRGRDSVLAMLRPGEKVLTLPQQASVISQSNPSVFDRAGVPRTSIHVGPAQAFQYGGTAQPSSFAPAAITLYVQLGMSDICSFDQAGKAPGKLQRAESIITIPPLEILGELTRTFQPGQVARLQMNYDDAQTLDLVDWSIESGGGTLTSNEFTADDEPGTTVIRATSGDQIAEMTINVPAIITPDFGFAAPLEQIDFNTNIPPTVTWSSVPNGINTSTGVWTLPDEPGRKVRISVTDGSFIATRDILIVPAFPFTDFSLPLSWDRNLSALVSMSEDRTSRITREKAPPYDSYPVKLTSRTLADCNAVDAFFDQQGYGKPFILEDKVRGIRKTGWFDSPIRHEARDECDIDLSFQFLEARI